MDSLNKIQNKSIIITLILGIIGFISLAIVSINGGLSFFIGSLTGILYLFHLGTSVSKISTDRKGTNSIIRLAISIVFMILIGYALSLNLILLFLGFLCNHLSMIIIVLSSIIFKRAEES